MLPGNEEFQVPNNANSDDKTAGAIERRSTSRALSAWQAVYWAKDDLPSVDDLGSCEWRDDQSLFLIALDRESSACALLPPDRAAASTDAQDITDTVPPNLLPRVIDAIRLAHESRRPVSCNGTIAAVEQPGTIAYRGIFLPLRDIPDQARIWLYGAFSYKQDATA